MFSGFGASHPPLTTARSLLFAITYALPNLQSLCFENVATVPGGGWVPLLPVRDAEFCLKLPSRLRIGGEKRFRSWEKIAMGLFDFGDRRELEKKAKAEGRLPPGQSLTLKWPVLHYGSVPTFDSAKWDFKISGLVEEPKRLTWNEFRALPQTEVTSDFHCVTRWSRLECAGINRREVANGRVVQVRPSEPTWPRVMRG